MLKIILSVALLASATPLVAQDVVFSSVMRPDGPVERPGISGQAGQVYDAFEWSAVRTFAITTPFALAQVDAPSIRKRFLTGLKGAENNDRPCLFQAEFIEEGVVSPRNPLFRQVPMAQDLYICGGRISRFDEKAVSLPWPFAVEVDQSRRAIIGVNVCLNRNGNRIKGVAIRGARVSATGAVTPEAAFEDEFDRPNCKGRWSSWSTCSSGKVATGIDYHVTDDGRGRSVSGLELQCQAVAFNDIFVRD